MNMPTFTEPACRAPPTMLMIAARTIERRRVTLADA
jgi:hypothetical protein